MSDWFDCLQILEVRYRKLQHWSELLDTIDRIENPDLRLVLVVTSTKIGFQSVRFLVNKFLNDIQKHSTRIRINPYEFRFRPRTNQELRVNFLMADYERIIGYDPSTTAFLWIDNLDTLE